DGHDRPRGLLDEKLQDGGVRFERDDVARLRANYAGKVTLIDDQIGEVLRAVDERGEWERTVVALVSDHGEMNGDYRLIYKGNFLNPAARVPFVIRAAGATAGTVANSIVELMDVGPTLVELAGGRPLRHSLAKSVVPLLDDPSRRHREVGLSELRREIMLATPDWKVAQNRAGEVYLLFDLRADPSETRNVAGVRDYQEIERDLHRQLERAVRAAR
ncbi:MAG: sulfatase-like hydrolase/transferase, partial [Gemmatimonadota bacterium]|nr:sulfatase-like hydrolase/transferase [Gemmatimonadota bacterium]